MAWWSWRNAQEYCGFLEFVWRLGAEPCEAVDLSDARMDSSGRDGAPRPANVAGSLALLSSEQILGNCLFDRAEPLAAESRAELRERWSRLRAEDAPVRVSTGRGGIESAPLSFFDGVLLGATKGAWRPTARVVAEVLGHSSEFALPQTSGFLLTARVHALATAGRIELRGGDPRQGMGGTEIRLPDRAAAATPRFR